MKKFAKLLSVLLAAVMILSLTGCAKAPAPANPVATAAPATVAPATAAPATTAPATKAPAEKSYKIVLHHPGALTNPYHLGILKFQELVESKTNKGITIDIHPNNELYSGAKSVEALQMGTLDMVMESTMSLSNFVPEAGVFDLPFLFSSKEKVYKVLDGKIGQELSDKAAAKGLKIVTYFENGFRNLSNSKKAINSPADLKGLKIRVPESKVFIATFTTLGAIPTPMAFGELYTALSLGTVDGQENPCSHMVDSKFYEVQKHFAITNHVFTAEPLMIRTNLFKEMSANQQKIILDCAKEAAIYQRKLANDVEQDYLKKIEAQKVGITYPDKKLFQDAVKPVYDQFRTQYGDLIDRILAE